MLKQIDVWMIKLIKAFAAFSMVMATLIIFMNVIMRYIFQAGITGSDELVRFLIIGVTFIGGSLLIIDREHLTMDAIVTILPESVNRIVEIVVCFIGFIFSVLLVVYSFNVMDTLGSGLTPGLQIPSYVPFLAITIGSLLTALKFVQRAIIQFKSEGGTSK